MLNRVLIVWIVFAGIMGFAIGGSFVAALQISLSQHEPQQKTADQNAKEKVDEHNTKVESLWVPTDSVGLYTLVLAVFTGLLVFVSAGQGYFLLRADKTARISANAAHLSARAAIAMELPIIRATVGKMGWSETQDAVGIKRYYIWIQTVYFSNVGRTQAFPIELECGCIFGEMLPTVPAYSAKKAFTTNTIFKFDAEDSYDVSIMEFQFDVPADAYNQLRSQTGNLWFYCNLIYLDFMQSRHESGFCWRRQQGIGPGRFLVDSTPAYNRKI